MDNRLLDSLKKHEGLRLKSYQDSEGIWTIGYGRNLQALQITEDQADRWLREDAESAKLEAEGFPEYQFLDSVARRNVFIEMVFNLGASRLSKFKKMLAAIREQDWEEVSKQMLDSKWAGQVGKRARTLSRLMARGTYE